MLPLQVPKNPDLGSDAERVRKEEQKKIDESDTCTQEETNEKEELLKQVSRLGGVSDDSGRAHSITLRQS